MFRRRKYLTRLGAGTGLAFLPIPTLAKWEGEVKADKTIIDAKKKV